MQIRIILFSTMMLVWCGAALAQRPGPEFWRRVSCEPFEPRTKLEALEDRHSTVIVKGFTRITTLEIPGLRVDAVEMHDMGGVSRAKGVVVALQGNSERASDNRAFVDYDEIDPLLNAIDAISRVDENWTKLVSFEARYRTLGDLELGVFRQTRSGAAATITTGICNQATGTLSLDELAKVKAMIQEAKTRLDDIR
jgi:hypothetical protein